MNQLRLITPRLELVAEDVSIARAAVDGREALAAALDATVPDEWPSEMMAGAQGYWIEHLEADPDLVGWAVWHIIRKDDRTLVGSCAFKGVPHDGRIDIGYEILESYRCQGYATEATRAIIDWAFSDARVSVIVGETLPELTASIRVMERLGFQLVSRNTVSHEGDEGVMQFVLERSPRGSGDC